MRTFFSANAVAALLLLAHAVASADVPSVPAVHGVSAVSWVSGAPGAAQQGCMPDGPRLPRRVEPDNHLMLRPGWVTLRMHVRPGAVAVTNVRVVSESGGPMHARNWLPLVRQWVGCAENERETDLEANFSFGFEGIHQQPAKEGFGPYAFKEPRGTPALPPGDWGIGVCPIRATLVLRRPDAPNVLVDLESEGGTPVREWLEQLVPDTDYMTPNPKGNRVEFRCKVQGGAVSFYER